MVLVLAPEDGAQAQRLLPELVEIGEVVASDEGRQADAAQVVLA